MPEAARESLVQEMVAAAVRSYLYEALSSAEEALQTQAKLSIDQGIPLALSASFATEAAGQAVDLVHSRAGTSGIRNALPFQRHFRDVHTLSQHAFVSPSRFESVGKLMLGRESDWPFYYL
jgi:alkylation response protein AidB-like acyl-CoA dehydrogenase